MKRRCSDGRLWRLVKELLIALEDPAVGFVFDDYDLRYRERERIREKNSSEFFYRDKTPFETWYESDCGANGDRDPAWASDGGRGAAAGREELGPLPATSVWLLSGIAAVWIAMGARVLFVWLRKKMDSGAQKS